MSAEPDMCSDDEWDGSQNGDSPERTGGPNSRETPVETEDPNARKAFKVVDRVSPSPSVNIRQLNKSSMKASPTNENSGNHKPMSGGGGSGGGGGQSRPGELHRAATAHKGNVGVDVVPLLCLVHKIFLCL